MFHWAEIAAGLVSDLQNVDGRFFGLDSKSVVSCIDAVRSCHRFTHSMRFFCFIKVFVFSISSFSPALPNGGEVVSGTFSIVQSSVVFENHAALAAAAVHSFAGPRRWRDLFSFAYSKFSGFPSR